MRRRSLQTPDEFISLASRLRAQAQPREEDAGPAEIAFEDEAAEPYAAAERDLLRDVRLFRARVAEALEQTLRALLCDIAAEVLARELQLAPPEIETIVARSLERFAKGEPLRLRVHPADAPAVQCGIPVVEDARLPHGDVVIELRDGAVVSSLGLRLEAVLANVIS